MARRMLLGTLALLAVSASPALAQTVTVGIDGTTYDPSNVKIAPGGSVSLPHQAGVHPLRGEAPIVDDQGGSYDFPDAGAYRFYCNFHGSAGMHGVIRVGTVAPVADIAVQGTPTAGKAVTLTAVGTTDEDEVRAEPGFPHPNDTRTYAWDFDNDGKTDAQGTSATVQHTYLAAGNVTAKVTVTDRTDVSDDDTVSFTVAEAAANRAPSAALSFSPASPGAGDQITLSGAGSSDPDGDALAYSWDLDGNGTFETATAATAATTVSFASAGTYTVRLRVSDGALTADATQSITVSARPTQTQPPTLGSSGPGDSVALRPLIRRVGKRVGRRVKIRVTCPAAETGGCRGTLAGKVGRKKLRAQRFRLRAGRSRTLTFKVPKARSGTLLLTGATRDAAGNRASIRVIVKF